MQEKLQGCQPLLAVNDDAFLHLARGLLDLLQDYGAEKVGMMLICRLAHHAVRDTCYVVPQRLPLVFFVPDVGPLKQGND